MILLLFGRVFIRKKFLLWNIAVQVYQLFVKASFQCFMAQMKPTLRAGAIKKGHSELTQIYKSSQNCVCNSLLLDKRAVIFFFLFKIIRANIINLLRNHPCSDE